MSQIPPECLELPSYSALSHVLDVPCVPRITWDIMECPSQQPTTQPFPMSQMSHVYPGLLGTFWNVPAKSQLHSLVPCQGHFMSGTPLLCQCQNLSNITLEALYKLSSNESCVYDTSFLKEQQLHSTKQLSRLKIFDAKQLLYWLFGM